MKKALLMLIVLLLVLLTACTDCFQCRDIEKIILISHDSDIEVELNPDTADFERIIEICRGNTYEDYPSCPFGLSEIRFVSGENSISNFPVGDDCCTFAVGDISNDKKTLVKITEKDMQELRDILIKYGITVEGV